MLELDWSDILPNLDYILGGMWVTLKILVVAISFGIVWGTCLAIMRVSSKKILHYFAAFYIDTFRSIPLVMVLLWFFLLTPQQKIIHYFGLAPDADIRIISAMIAFALFEAAYYAEIIRAGIGSVSKGQMFAALALGMTKTQVMCLIILPQAFRIITPLLLNQGIILFQDITLVYIMSLADFFYRSVEIVGTQTGSRNEFILFTAAVYFVICFAASLIIKYLKKRAY